MKIVRSIKEMAEFSRKAKASGKSIGFVPTMGALHAGHVSLMRRARKENKYTVVSIFVNPIQFGPKEDFKKYPRSLNRDASICRKEGVDAIFYPSAKEIYPCSYKTYVTVEGLSDVLCAEFRPGHFRGVAIVVTKLFNIVQPDVAYFGQKDGQQAIIIKQMASDLNMPLKIKVLPTVREKDGLALSSRNIYLKPQERKDATVLYESLKLAKNLFLQGNRDSNYIISKMRQLIRKKNTAKVQYVSISDLEDLKPVSKITKKVMAALAVKIGRTRLIDNIILGP